MYVMTFDVDAASKIIKSAPELHGEGLQFFNKGKYREAIDVWLKELELDYQNAHIVNDIGIAYRRLGEHTISIQYHKRAIELDLNFGHAYYSLGLAYYDLKDYDQAKTAFLKAVELKYGPGVSYYNLGLSYYYLNDHEQAKAAFLNAIKFNYDLSSSYFILGEIYCELRDYEKAIAAFKKVLELNHSIHGAHYYLGKCYRSLNKLYLARKEFKKEYEQDTPWAIPSLKEIREIEQEASYIKLLDYLDVISLFLIGGFGIPIFVLIFFKKKDEFYRPEKQKVILLISFLLFFPSPFALILPVTLISFAPLAIGLMPAFYLFIFTLGMSSGMIEGWKIVGFAMSLLYYSALVFFNYLIVCFLYKIVKNKYLLWAIMGILISVSFLNIYWVADAGGGGHIYNSIKLIKEFSAQFLSNNGM